MQPLLLLSGTRCTPVHIRYFELFYQAIILKAWERNETKRTPYTMLVSGFVIPDVFKDDFYL